MVVNQDNITRLLRRIDGGEGAALEELMRLVYNDLERMAAAHLRGQFGARASQLTLEPAALVHESFLKLIKQRKGFDNRGQFFAIATRLMLRVLAEYRRNKAAAKRGGDGRAFSPVTLSIDPDRLASGIPDGKPDCVEAEALAHSIEKLQALDPRAAEILKMRIVWSMTVPEIAESLDLSASTIERDWRWAKAWLADDLRLIRD